jgi:hypothetical protein
LSAAASYRVVTLPELVGAVARSVLADWNPRPTDIRRMTASDFVRIHLGTRLDTSGPVADLADQLVYEPVGEQEPLWITFAKGEVVPNVVAWFQLPVWEGLDNDHVLAILGRAHGDLHADNILPHLAYPWVRQRHDTSRHAPHLASDTPSVSLTPRTFAAIVGGLLTLVAIVVLVWPVSVASADDDITYGCGSALAGLNRSDIEAEDLRNAGREIGAAQYGTIPSLVDTTDLVERCEDRISTQRTWGFPIGGLGLIVLAGSFVNFAPPRRPTATADA